MIPRHEKGTIGRAQLELAIAVRHVSREFWRPVVRRFGLRRGPTTGEFWSALLPLRVAAYAWYGMVAVIVVLHFLGMIR